MPKHRERGPKRYEYTVETIAEATGLAVATIREYTAPARIDRGCGVDPADLRQVGLFVARHAKVKAAVPLLDEELFELLAFSPNERLRWPLRWPRFEVYRCPRNSKEVTFQPGVPRLEAFVRFGSLGHFTVKVGSKWVPYHQLVLPTPPELQVHHKDLNKWNNRYENLEALTWEIHKKVHREAVPTTAGTPPKPGT